MHGTTYAGFTEGMVRLFEATGIPRDIVGKQFVFRRAAATFIGTITGCIVPDDETLLLSTSLSTLTPSPRVLRYSRHTKQWAFTACTAEGSITERGERENYRHDLGTLVVYGPTSS